MIRLYHNGDHIGDLEGHESGITSLSWTNDPDRIVSGSWDGTCLYYYYDVNIKKVYVLNRNC